VALVSGAPATFPFEVADASDRLEPVCKRLGSLPRRMGQLPSVGQPSNHWRKLDSTCLDSTPLHHILPIFPAAASSKALSSPKALPHIQKASDAAALRLRGCGSQLAPIPVTASYHSFREHLLAARASAAACDALNLSETNSNQAVAERAATLWRKAGVSVSAMPKPRSDDCLHMDRQTTALRYMVKGMRAAEQLKSSKRYTGKATESLTVGALY
jgi:hypothetical protein